MNTGTLGEIQFTMSNAMKAYENFKEEMYKIELLYAGSVNSYWQNKLRNSERINAGYIKETDPIFYG